MTKPHVVHVLTRMLRAGSEENILLTSAGQIAEGYEVTLMFGAQSEPSLASRLAPQARLVEIPSMIRAIRPDKDLAGYREMRRALARLNPDVVHTHQSKAGIIGRAAAHAEKVPCIVHGVHILPFLGVGGPKRLLYLGAERAAARMTHGYLHVSQGMRDACRDAGIGQGVPHEILRSGFDIARFRDALPPIDKAELLGTGDTGQRPFVLTMLAALEDRKRHLELLDALAPIARKTPSLRIVFAGEGPLKDAIVRKSDALGISGAVRLVGYREDPERIIALSDICLLASGQEGLPRSVLQYLTAGKPIVLFDLPGLEEVIQGDRNALVVEPDDWHAFGRAVERLHGDAVLRRRLATAAVETDLSEWDWTTMGRRTNRFYRMLSGRAG